MSGNKDGLPVVTRPVCNFQDIMALPLFSLSKKKRTETLEVPFGKGVITVEPSPKYGLATIWDADILVWAITTIALEMKAGTWGNKRMIEASSYEILWFMGRSRGGKAYDDFTAALKRLRTCTVTVKYDCGKSVVDYDTSWINARKRVSRKGEPDRYGIELATWLLDGIANHKMLLKINPFYFRIAGGFERRLYNIARKFAGTQEYGALRSFKDLYRLSGSRGQFKRFAFNLRGIAERQCILDYHLSVQAGEDGSEWLHIIERRHSDVF